MEFKEQKDMKQLNIVRAYKAINSLEQQKLPLSVSHKLWSLKRILQPHWEFQLEKENEVVSSFNPIPKVDGSLGFESDEVAAKCKAEFDRTVNEIADLDVDLGDFNKIVLHFDDKLDLSVADIDALSEFVDFVE